MSSSLVETKLVVIKLVDKFPIPRKWQLFVQQGARMPLFNKRVISKINQINNALQYFVLYIDGKQFAGELQIIGYNGERKNINSIANHRWAPALFLNALSLFAL